MDSVQQFVPTVTDHSYQDGLLVLHTLDGRQESDIVSTEDGLKRKGELLSDEQQDKLALRE